MKMAARGKEEETQRAGKKCDPSPENCLASRWHVLPVSSSPTLKVDSDSAPGLENFLGYEFQYISPRLQ